MYFAILSQPTSNGMDPEKITYFGETDSRGKRVKFGIKAKDRTKHVYVIGKTGMGKSTLLENMAIQDLQNGEGLAFIDPHGKTAELLLNYIPPERIKDVVYFAPFDINHPISFNVMEDVGPDKRHLVVSGLMSAFKKLFGEESFSDRMQYILQNTILALLEYPGATMLGINRMLTDKAYRNKVVANVTDTSVKAYWTQEFAAYTERFAAEATPAIQNKIGQFTSNPLIRNIVGQSKSSFDFRKIMDEKKILIVNLSKGRVGEANANLLGSMLITKIYLAAMSRADIDEKQLKKLPNFYLYVDEFQSFANESFADILSEARKYKLNLTMAHQYIEQMSEEVRAAVFGNVGTMIAFRVGAFDAEVLEKEFAPQFTAEDLVNLGMYQMYLKLMIDAVGSQPFSASGLPPFPEPVISYKSEIIESSRKSFAKAKLEVEEIIAKWYEEGRPPSKKDKQHKLEQNNNIVQKPQESLSVSKNPDANKQSHDIEKQKHIDKPEIKKDKSKHERDFPPLEDSMDDDFLPLKELAKKIVVEPAKVYPVKLDSHLTRVEVKEQFQHKKSDTSEQSSNHNNNKQKSQNANGKAMSGKNLSDLRSALASVINKNADSVNQPQQTPKQEQKNEKRQEDLRQSTKEIPEEDLKKVLGI